jgi:hypothetical protein
MRTIVSLELDDNCTFQIFPVEGGLLFSQSPHLTHIRIALLRFEDCVRLLSQLGKQLRSFCVTIGSVPRFEDPPVPDITSVSDCL